MWTANRKPTCMTEKEAFIVLNALADVGPVRITNLIERFGTAEQALAAPIKEVSTITGVGRKIGERITNWQKYFDLEQEQKLMAKCGAVVVTVNENDYPPLLRNIYDPPPVLYVKGNIDLNTSNYISIVGARRASYYGINTARKLAGELVARGLYIVSGCTRGIDTAAHEGAVNAKGKTVAVFGCGIDRIYPPENFKLVDKITANGAVISEFPMGTPPKKENFPRRNRIISGMAQGVIVVEAGDRSGSLITARMAAEQGREVFSVPGRIDEKVSRGANILIKYGAKPVLNVDDVIEELMLPPAR